MFSQTKLNQLRAKNRSPELKEPEPMTLQPVRPKIKLENQSRNEGITLPKIPVFASVPKDPFITMRSGHLTGGTESTATHTKRPNFDIMKV